MFLRPFFVQKLINLLKHLPLSLLAMVYYSWPGKDLTLIGVTGTDGKTTTATLIYEILKKAGYKAALISTVAAKIGNKEITTGLHVTSPSPWQLEKLLRMIVDKGFKYVVLECTSHGLDQYRLFGINFKIGVITNVTHEHLDYHKTWEQYLAAKAKLFCRSQYCILNKDDASFDFLKYKSRDKIISYGIKSGDFTPQNFPFKTKLIGKYNQSNCLAAIAAVKTLGIKDKYIRQAVAQFRGVIGRMQEIKKGQNFRVFIDFAHTPNALEQALKTLRALKPRKLIAVFGCAGLRDSKKRPLMGEISCRLADKVVLTAEDPRTEDANEIIDQIIKGCREKKKIYRHPDRQKAIEFALLKLAQRNDLVGIFGKGHEQSMCFGRKERPWSDHQAVGKALAKRRRNE